MLLTLGMATANDFHGVAFTVQSLILHHDLKDCEIVVVDNAPEGKHGKEVKRFTEGIGVRYVAMGETNGTTQTRERVFTEAQGEAVLVMDCHVLFIPNAIAKLKQYFLDNPQCRDLLTGPLILRDNPRNVHTHFNDVWRGGMWGIWGNAWRCTCDDPLYFTTLQRGEEIAFADLATSRHENTTGCLSCGKAFPKTPWPGHEKALINAGFQPLGLSDNDPSFEIPAMGLGIFGCRKDAWPGFNPNFRGFGGEEMFIHEKFRQRGDHALCLPFLKWWHRFGRPDGTQYVNRVFDRVRNYVLGHQELGLSLDPVHRQFVSLDTYGRSLYDHLKYEHGDGDDKLKAKTEAQLENLHRSHKLTQAQWDALLADPVGYLDPVREKQPVTVELDGGRVQPPAGSTLNQIFDWCKDIKRDLDQHLPAMRELAQKCDHVTELTKRRESTVAFLAARPQTLISYQLEKDILLTTLSTAIKNDHGAEGRKTATHTIHWGKDSLEAATIEETDLLFIDTIHTADRLKAELARHGDRVRRFIVLRGTGANGERGEGGGEGLFYALKPWMAAHPQWFIVWHTDAEYGMTAIGCLPDDRPAQPVHAWAPGYGPGTELKAILASQDINPSPSCDCNAKAVIMDKWGVDGCRRERETIVGWLREGAPRWKWTEALAAATEKAKQVKKAVKTGLAWRINPLDQFGSLVDEAIRRAEVAEQKK